jgi:hypothetical protein
MVDPIIQDISPDPIVDTPAPDETLTVTTPSVESEPSVISTIPPVIESPAVEPIAPVSVVPPDETPTASPPAASEVILGSKADGDLFLEWAFNGTISFLDLADLPKVKTAEALRGLSESKICDKIQVANSVLVLLANYGSKNDNVSLVRAAELYAAKMKTIIQRLCL